MAVLEVFKNATVGWPAWSAQSFLPGNQLQGLPSPALQPQIAKTFLGYQEGNPFPGALAFRHQVRELDSTLWYRMLHTPCWWPGASHNHVMLARPEMPHMKHGLPLFVNKFFPGLQARWPRLTQLALMTSPSRSVWQHSSKQAMHQPTCTTTAARSTSLHISPTSAPLRPHRRHMVRVMHSFGA